MREVTTANKGEVTQTQWEDALKELCPFQELDESGLLGHAAAHVRFVRVHRAGVNRLQKKCAAAPSLPMVSMVSQGR